MAGAGGRRTGAGRKKGSPNKKTRERRLVEAQAHEVFVNMVLARYKPYIETLLREGEGNYTVVDTDKNGNRIKQPDGRLMLDTLSFVIAKPKTTNDTNVSYPQLEKLQNYMEKLLSNRKD